jgi:hypothetical protein
MIDVTRVPSAFVVVNQHRASRGGFDADLTAKLKYAAAHVPTGEKAEPVTLLLAPSAEGRSLLDRLTAEQLGELMHWMASNPGGNGMSWPGWVNVVKAFGPASDPSGVESAWEV